MAMLIGASAKDVAHVLTRIASRKVVYVPSVGDGASPVWLVAGDYSRQIGQCADWRHNVELAAEQHAALYVEGSYDTDRWVVGIPEEYSARVCAEMRIITVAQEESRDAARMRRLREEMDRREAERPAREARAAAYRDECEARAIEYRPIYDAARARVRLKANGQPHRGDTRALEWAYGKACGTVDCYGDYDRAAGLLVLRRLAAEGFVETATV